MSKSNDSETTSQDDDDKNSTVRSCFNHGFDHFLNSFKETDVFTFTIKKTNKK